VQFARFLLVGGANTAASYAVYLLLLLLVDYRIAYTVAFEHKTVGTPGGGRATYTLRTTHVFRREDGEWRIVHRHGDRPPERGDFPIAPTPSTA